MDTMRNDIFASAVEPIIIVDGELKILFMNVAAEGAFPSLLHLLDARDFLSAAVKDKVSGVLSSGITAVLPISDFGDYALVSVTKNFENGDTAILTFHPRPILDLNTPMNRFLSNAESSFLDQYSVLFAASNLMDKCSADDRKKYIDKMRGAIRISFQSQSDFFSLISMYFGTKTGDVNSYCASEVLQRIKTDTGAILEALGVKYDFGELDAVSDSCGIRVDLKDFITCFHNLLIYLVSASSDDEPVVLSAQETFGGLCISFSRTVDMGASFGERELEFSDFDAICRERSVGLYYSRALADFYRWHFEWTRNEKRLEFSITVPGVVLSQGLLKSTDFCDYRDRISQYIDAAFAYCKDLRS